MQTATASNPYAAQARARKLLRLVATIDALARRTGRPAHAIATWLRGLPTAGQEPSWAALAVCAGVRPPSATTRDAVVAYYDGEAARWESLS